MIEFLFGVIVGIVGIVGYGAYRALNSDNWNNSNLFNWLRLLNHVYTRPEDFGQMYYLNEEEITRMLSANINPIKPFDYIEKDEL